MLIIYFKSVYVKARVKRSERKMQTQNQFLLCSPFYDEIRKFGAESSFGKLTFNSLDDTCYIKLFSELTFSTVSFSKRFPEEKLVFILSMIVFLRKQDSSWIPGVPGSLCTGMLRDSILKNLQKTSVLERVQNCNNTIEQTETKDLDTYYLISEQINSDKF